ncbi:hypothetical protein L9F63_003705, partial [Diploptera punctata]
VYSEEHRNCEVGWLQAIIQAGLVLRKVCSEEYRNCEVSWLRAIIQPRLVLRKKNTGITNLPSVARGVTEE